MSVSYNTMTEFTFSSENEQELSCADYEVTLVNIVSTVGSRFIN